MEVVFMMNQVSANKGCCVNCWPGSVVSIGLRERFFFTSTKKMCKITTREIQDEVFLTNPAGKFSLLFL